MFGRERFALKEGAQVRIAGESGSGTRLVPEPWAERHIAYHREKRENGALIGHYYNVPKVATIFGVSPTSVRYWALGRYRIGRYMAKNVRIVKALKGRTTLYLFNPYDIEDHREAIMKLVKRT